jgi:hypothetical protein
LKQNNNQEEMTTETTSSIGSFFEKCSLDGNQSLEGLPANDDSKDTNDKAVSIFKPFDLNKITDGWSSEELDIFIRANKLDQQFILGYCDMHKHGDRLKTSKDVVLNDKVAILGVYDKTKDNVQEVLKDIDEKEVTIKNISGETYTGRFRDFSEIWDFPASECILYPPDSQSSIVGDPEKEAKVIEEIIHSHNVQKHKEWENDFKEVKKRASTTKKEVDENPSFVKNAEKEEEDESEESKTQKEEEHKQKMRALFDDADLRETIEMDMDNKLLPWFVCMFITGQSKTCRSFKGLLRVFGPFSQKDSRVFIEAISKNMSTANVYGTQLNNLGSLSNEEQAGCEEVVISDKFISALVTPSQQNQDLAKNFDSLMTERQKLYHKMCREKGIKPVIVENAGGRTTSVLNEDGEIVDC